MLTSSSHDFSTIINLPPGTHRLKFQVDGEYRCSDELPTATDSVGNLVNYVEVSEEDFALNNPDMEGGAAQSALSRKLFPCLCYTTTDYFFLKLAVNLPHSHMSMRCPPLSATTMPRYFSDHRNTPHPGCRHSWKRSFSTQATP